LLREHSRQSHASHQTLLLLLLLLSLLRSLLRHPHIVRFHKVRNILADAGDTLLMLYNLQLLRHTIP
jgi:hypothetical protein